MSTFPPVYVGNYEYDASERELEDQFKKYGPVKTLEFKSGFCFVYYDDERDAEECIRRLDGREWGRLGRRLRVEFAKNDANVRAREAKRRSGADPNNTLFVAGFDPRGTRAEELEKVFEEFGRLKRCDIKKTFAFVEFENVDDAKVALESMHGRQINGREVTVEYVVRKEGERKDRGGGGGGGGRRERGGRFEDRDRRRYDDRERGGRSAYNGDRGGGSGGGGGRRQGRDRFDDRGPPRHGAGGGGGRRGRSRSRSRDRYGGGNRGGGGGGGRRRSPPAYDRSRSPPPRRGRSPSPRRSPPAPAAAYDRQRERSPLPARRGSPSRSRSPMVRDD